MATYTAAQIAQVAASVGFSGNNLAMAVAIAQAESGGNTSVISSAGDVGLWQINQPLHPQYSIAQLQNPQFNAQVAFSMSSGGSNWRPWCTAYSDGACGTRGGTYLGSGSPYQKYLSVQAPIGVPVSMTTPTIPLWCKPFMAQSIAWWEANGNHYPTSSEGWSEGGVDWTPQPNNLPITALLPGVVVGAGYFCKDGSSNQFCRTTYMGCTGAQGYGVVTIRSNNPFPNLVPGSQIDIYYQHIIIDPSIFIPHCDGSLGQSVVAGQTIGHANGSFNVEVGVNIGSSWGGIWGTKSPGPHVDPIPFLWTLINSGVSSGVYTGGSGGTITLGYTQTSAATYTPLSQQVHETLINAAGFYPIALAIDEAEQFPGWVDLTTQITVNVLGSNIPVPDFIGLARSIGATATDNFIPFAIRASIVALGLFIVFSLIAKAVSGPAMQLAPLLAEAM